MIVFIHTMFEGRVNQQKNAIALSMDENQLTYLELNSLANKLADQLIKSGVVPGDIVGICMERSFELVAGLLAIMKVGAAYLPLDTEYPVERLKYMLFHSKVSRLLVHQKLAGMFSASDVELIIYNKNQLESFNSTNPIIDTSKISLAYVIYTSGSTGMPKGIAMGVRPLINLIEWQNDQGQLGQDAITLQYTPVSFDVHFQEIFSTLTLGGRLVLVSEQQRLDTLQLLKLIEKQQINKIFLPYVALNHLCEMAIEFNSIPTTLREITTAGEQLKISKGIRLFFEKCSSAVLYNHYGPSETHVVTSFKLNGNPQNWPNLPSIGKAIKDVSIHVVNTDLKPCLPGEEGELIISGDCLAQGYLHREDLTAERFINTDEWGRVYRTGDLGLLNIEGNFIFLGRRDSQVKMRGYRIELGEIELAIQKNQFGGPCVVNVVEDGHESYLCAYVNGHAEFDNAKLRDSLRLELPEYMVPSYFIKINKIPLTPSGKVDYKNLPILTHERPDLMNEFEAAHTASQLMIERCWKKYLKIGQLGIDDSFFDLGGNSLMAIKIMADINQQVKKRLTIVNFFQFPTIRLLAKFIDEKNDLLENVEKEIEQSAYETDIAIIGVHGKFPGASNVDEFWENLLLKKNPLKEFSIESVNPFVRKELATDPAYVRVQGVYPEQELFDNLFFGITPREAELMDPQQRKFLELTYHAFELAGYRTDLYEGAIGIFAGMGNSKYNRLVDLHPAKVAQLGDFNVMLGLEKDYIATRVAYKLNLRGPALSIHTGCSTSLVAIIEAVKSLRLRQCDMALAGGISISGMPNTGHLYQSGGIYSQDGLCRPFDEQASGTLFTEGGGVVLLKRLSDAEKGGDNILAVIKGIGLNNDGAEKMSFTAPSVQGQAQAILNAQRDARIKAESIGYIEAHGTGTPIGDPIEVEALSKAFSHTTDKKQYCLLSSVKSNIGHLTAAAGVASFIKATLAVKHGIVPGTAHYEVPNKMLDLVNSPFIITDAASEFPKSEVVRRAGISSFGVGGTNAHVIIEEYISENLGIESDAVVNSPTLFKLSAKSIDQVVELKKDLILQLQKTQRHEWKKIAFTLEVGRKTYKYKDYLVLNDHSELNAPMKSKKSTLNKSNQDLILMFPGQGSQYRLMGKNLYEHIKFFRERFDECCAIISPILGYDLKSFIHDDSQSEMLNNTFYSQPVIFVTEYCLARTVLELGYSVKALVGHSIGEYVAATVAGVFSLEDGLKTIAMRAKLMRDLPAGMMLSLPLHIEEVKPYLNELNISVAAINSDRSCVLSGEISEIEQLKIRLTASSTAYVELKTSHAFHSSMMLPVVPVFEEFLKTIKLNKPKIAIYSTVTAQKEDSLLTNASYWAQQIGETVLFKASMDKIKSENLCAVFLETGTKNILGQLLKKESRTEIEQGTVKVVSLLSSSVEKEVHHFLDALGELWMEGINFSQLKVLYQPEDQRRHIAPVYPFAKNVFWLGPFNNDQSRKLHTEDTFMNDGKLTALKDQLSDLFERSSGIPVSEFEEETTFMEMGMDSLFLTQISLQIKKELKISVTFRQLVEELTTINQLAGFLLKKNFSSSPEPKRFSPEKDPEENPLESPDEVSLPSITPEPIPRPRPSPMPSTPEVPNREVINPVGALESREEIKSIIQRQLDLMNLQLSLLTHSPVKVSVPKAIDCPVVKEAVFKTNTQRGADIKKSKEAFGAAARITVEKTAKLDLKQLDQVKQFFSQYEKKTQSSKKFTQENRKNHADPRVVTGFKPESKEICYPIVVKKSHNQTFWDLDDNQYIDMTCGFGSNFFGNQNEIIKKHILNQIEEGIELGPQHPLVGEVSNMIAELTGNERSAFCNTGSEAVLGAMRLARTVTGREKIIVFSGSYHGINDEVILRGGKNGSASPAAPGINNESVSNMIVLEYGTSETLMKIKDIAHEVAAVLVEPVQSRRCNFHPVDFLKEVRRITQESETCLIFDEIITGFRIHPAGAQGYFGIKADLCTYGKIVGGGMPIGVISGKSEYMDALDGGFWQYGDDSTPTVGVTYFAGTFVRHPLALAAAKGALSILKEGGVSLLADLNRRSQVFVDDLNRFLLIENVPLEMNNFGSLMKLKWTRELPGGELLFAVLRYNGIHAYDGFPWFINLAHTEAELHQVLQIFKDSVKKMQSMGLFPKKEKSAVFDPLSAPVIGAKIGRDDQGNPAWFIENPEKHGEYFLLEG